MKHVLIGLALCLSIGATAQNVGIGTPSPNANAKLDITATDKGLLIPRMDSVHRKAIPNTVGLLVYDSTTKSFWVNNGVAWQNMAASASGWSLTGNSGTTDDNFLGTRDNRPLNFITANIPSGKIDKSVTSLGRGAYSAASDPAALRFIVAIGDKALSNSGPNTINNTAVGSAALSANINGAYNTAVGAMALTSATEASLNTAVGSAALSANTTGSNNTAIGALALTSATEALYNTAVGQGSLSGTTTGSSNTAVGFWAMVANNTGGGNSAFGFSALGENRTGTGNTAIGRGSLGTNTDGSNNTGVGIFTSANPSATNATAIGANALVDASNKIRLGDEYVTIVESNGVFNTVSDGRFKYNIKEDVKGLDFIMNLRPVTYQFDAKKQEDFTKGIISAALLNSHAIPAAYNENNGIKRTGFIAQEVEAAAQKTGFDFDGVKTPATDKQYYSLSYASFVVPLVKAMQEQQQVIDALKKQNELLQQQNEAIIKRLEALEKK